jgi:hypothetical protein
LASRFQQRRQPTQPQQLLELLPEDIVERIDLVFFSDPMTAARKGLGMTQHYPVFL